MRRVGRWARRYRHALEGVAGNHAQPSAPDGSSGRVVLTHDDLLWFKTSRDEEGRITLGLLECSREAIGVLVDDNGESLGLLLSRHEAQDLHRALVAWLAGTTRRASP